MEGAIIKLGQIQRCCGGRRGPGGTDQGLWEAAGAKEETSSQTARSRTLVWTIMETNVVNLVTQEQTLAGDEIQISKRPTKLQATEQRPSKTRWTLTSRTSSLTPEIFEYAGGWWSLNEVANWRSCLLFGSTEPSSSQIIYLIYISFDQLK